MNYTILYGVACWLTLWSPIFQLAAQTGYPTNFCSDSSEISNCYPGSISSALNERYGTEKACLVETLAYSPHFPTTEGDTACYPFFGSPVIKLSDESFVSQLNGERSAWNITSDLAFFRGPNNASITFFDEDGDKIDDHQFNWKDFYHFFDPDWTDKLTTIRWHPSENAIFYPKEHQLIKRRVSVSGSQVSLGNAQVLASFPGYRIGMNYGGPHRIAGGDGNDVNAGRFLISLVRSDTTDYLVYDFNEDAIITQNITLGSGSSYSEIPRSVSSFTNYLFKLPRLDYAQVSASGLFIVAAISDTATGTEQIELYDFDGNRYDISDGPSSTRDYLFSVNAHHDVTFVEVDSGLIRECIVVRTISSGGNPTTPNNGDGDVNALYWWIDKDSSAVNWGMMKLLDWLSNNSKNLSAAQYSAVPGFHEAQDYFFYDSVSNEVFSVPDSFTYRMLAIMREVSINTQYIDHINNGNDCNVWRVYMGEIVELSLTFRDTLRDTIGITELVSTTPRRIVHHWVPTIRYLDNSGDTVRRPILQPEAWFSPDGSKMFFKSPDLQTTADVEDEHLFFMKIPDRTC